MVFTYPCARCGLPVDVPEKVSPNEPLPLCVRPDCVWARAIVKPDENKKSLRPNPERPDYMLSRTALGLSSQTLLDWLDKVLEVDAPAIPYYTIAPVYRDWYEVEIKQTKEIINAQECAKRSYSAAAQKQLPAEEREQPARRTKFMRQHDAMIRSAKEKLNRLRREYRAASPDDLWIAVLTGVERIVEFPIKLKDAREWSSGLHNIEQPDMEAEDFKRPCDLVMSINRRSEIELYKDYIALRLTPAYFNRQAFEDRVIRLAFHAGLFIPTPELAKKYPPLRVRKHIDLDTQRESEDGQLENQLALKTGGAPYGVGTRVYGGGWTSRGQRRGLSSLEKFGENARRENNEPTPEDNDDSEPE
jgi:hypothetical protein